MESKNQSGASILSHDKTKNTMEKHCHHFSKKILNSSSHLSCQYFCSTDVRAGWWRWIQAFENKCYRRMLGISYRESVKQTNMYGNRSISTADVTIFNCQPSSVASYHGTAMYVKMRCRRSYYNEQWLVVVAEEDLVNHGRTGTTPRNGQASRAIQVQIQSPILEIPHKNKQRLNIVNC